MSPTQYDKFFLFVPLTIKLVIPMTLYADMLFLINFIMNSFILWVVSKITRNKRKTRWLFVAAALMSCLYTLLIAIEPLRSVSVAASSVVILVAGVPVAFHLSGAKDFIRQMLIAYIISFTVGGLGMALFFLTSIPYALYFLVGNPQNFAREISWQLVPIATAASYVLIKLGLKIAQKHTMKRQMLCNVQVFVDEQGVSFHALVDTGHSLKEPLSKSHVIVAEFEHVKDFLPDTLKVMFYEKCENDLSGWIDRDAAFYKRIRMIPFTSLGRKSGMLIGFRPDRVAVEGAKETPADNVVIGIYNDKLCQDGRYQGLLSPELIA